MTSVQNSATPTKIAIPVAAGLLAPHFGHCERFVLFAVRGKTIDGREELAPPPHVPGALPKWVHDQGATVIIAQGMGARAQDLFMEYGIEMILGARGEPDLLVRQYLEGCLAPGTNTCEENSCHH